MDKTKIKAKEKKEKKSSSTYLKPTKKDKERKKTDY